MRFLGSKCHRNALLAGRTDPTRGALKKERREGKEIMSEERARRGRKWEERVGRG